MLEIEYDVTYLNESYISIKFYGSGDADSYPTKTAYAININLAIGDKISLEEILDVNTMLDTLRYGNFHLQTENDYILEEYTSEEIAERYKNLGMSPLELPRYSTFLSYF